MQQRITSQTSLPTEHGFFEELYRALLLPRLVEERMLLLLRQGMLTKWFSGIGQEAISVGTATALHPTDWILPLIRNLGVFTTRGIALERLFAQFRGCREGLTLGRDRSFHFGSREHHIVGMISHLGPQLGVADGLALAENLRREIKSEHRGVVAAFSGDGGTSEGDFHEALNVAAVWELPVLFILENNHWALSTPARQQYRCEHLRDKALGYGMEGITIDGNDVLEVYATISHFARELRERPRPVLIECMTYRMRGHEEASGIAYVSPSELAEWREKDPIVQFERVLDSRGIVPASVRDAIRTALLEQIAAAVEVGWSYPPRESTPEEEMRDVFAPTPATRAAEKVASSTSARFSTPSGRTPEGEPIRRFVDAVSLGLHEAMARDPRLVLMGQDIAEYGGVFKVTEGFIGEFGADRVRNTPLCESAIVGVGLGLSVAGIPSIIEMQFADFVSCAFTQIVNNLAKVHYRWGCPASVVIRLPTGAGVRAGPFHSQSTEAWFFHVPGLKIVYPAFPSDARSLLHAAVTDPNPVLFFEHKALYRSIEGPVPEVDPGIALGSARIVRAGTRVTIVTYGLGVHWALRSIERYQRNGGENEVRKGVSHDDIELIDLRSLAPWDHELVAASVRKTGRALVLHEDTLTGGIGAEIAAWIAEHLFPSLDAPVVRVGSLDTPVPFAAALEDHFLASARLDSALAEILAY